MEMKILKITSAGGKSNTWNKRSNGNSRYNAKSNVTKIELRRYCDERGERIQKYSDGDHGKTEGRRTATYEVERRSDDDI